MQFTFHGEQVNGEDRATIEERINCEIRNSWSTGRFNWPERDLSDNDAFDGPAPRLQIEWFYTAEPQPRVTAHLRDWEALLEEYEEDRRRRIAESNEY